MSSPSSTTLLQREAEQGCAKFVSRHRLQIIKDLDDSRSAYSELLHKVKELSRHRAKETGSIEYYKLMVCMTGNAPVHVALPFDLSMQSRSQGCLDKVSRLHQAHGRMDGSLVFHRLQHCMHAATILDVVATPQHA